MKHCLLLLGLLVLAGSATVARAADDLFTPPLAGGWKIGYGKYALTEDPVYTQVLTADPALGLTADSAQPLAGAVEARLRVRLKTVADGSAYASLYLNKKDAADPGLRVYLQASGAENVIAGDCVYCYVLDHGKDLHDLAALSKGADWDATNQNWFGYKLQSYNAIWPYYPTDLRALLAADMPKLPGHNAKWLELRVLLQPGRLRVWLDDRLVAEKTAPSLAPDGFAQVALTPGVQVAYCRITPAPREATTGFEPIPLSGYVNASDLLGQAGVMPASLPAPGRVTRIGGIPFVFPGMNDEGNDHLDVGMSLCRENHQEGYVPTHETRYAGSGFRDQRRLQLRIPYRQYDRLYLIAAADGDPDEIPLVTASFYRPKAGFAEYFTAGDVPRATARSARATRLGVTLTNGRKASLWLVTIPLDPGRLSAFADLDIFEVELTKQMHLFRSYPDPIDYGYNQGGPASSVHVFAATLGEAPVGYTLTPDHFGHVWTEPEVPGYAATVTNHTAQARRGTLTVATRSYDGSESSRQRQAFTVPAGAALPVKFILPVKLYGYHDVTATLQIGGRRWEERRSLVKLAPDRRAPRWTEGKGALFGYWSYHGVHNTASAEHTVELMTKAGARASINSFRPTARDPVTKAFTITEMNEHWAPFPAGAWEISPQPWAKDDPIDPKQYNAYKQKVIELYTAAREALPANMRPDHVYFFPEPGISARMTSGNWPEYWDGTPFTPTREEQTNIRMFACTAKAAAEAIREKWPELKILIPYGDPLFAVPLLRSGILKGLIDGSGLDICGFERLPEQQLHQISAHRLYELKHEYANAGIDNPALYLCEGIFVPTEPGSCSWREQMDIYTRFSLIAMGYGIKRFYSSWFAFDCASYYGAEHYGGCGIQRRIPYADPKPAYAAYATMTDRLDQADFDGWLPTGSLTTFCQRYRGPRGPVYPLWTLRGTRPVTLTLAADGAVQVTDAMNNSRTVRSAGRQVTVMTDPSVIYVTQAEIVAVQVGAPDHSDAAPAKGAKPIADPGDGSWHYSNAIDKAYEENAFAVQRYPGKFGSQVVEDARFGPVLRSTLERQDAVHALMPWYNILTPAHAIPLAGAPAAIGLWVKGHSDWGRVIFNLRDAGGERWVSIGGKDSFNCDDVHSWMSFNFDGWRYLRMELPGNLPYDSFRTAGSTWWRYLGGDGNGIVDLPLRLESITVEQRTHLLYVNDVQPAASSDVEFGKIYVEYARPSDATDRAVAESKLRMPIPPEDANMPNPIRELQASGVGAPTAITKLEPPTSYPDGTRINVFYRDVPEAKSYHVWVSPYPDGRAALNMWPYNINGLPNGGTVYYLRPGIPLYFWVTYRDAKGNMSKPSPAVEKVLVDEFKEK